MLPGFRPLSAGGEFWDAKPESDWSAAEVAQLTTSSPWAIAGRVQMAPAPLSQRSDPTNATFRGRTATFGPNPDAVVMTGPASSARNSSAPVAFYGQVTVSWESAAPIRLARKSTLPEEFNDCYAIRITGLPAQTFMPETGRIPVIIRLLTGTTLATSSKKHEQAYYVLRLPDEKSLIFAFLRHDFPLISSTGFVWFTMNLNEMKVRVRFDLRSMNFRGVIAV
jgi:hypothetical protein